MIDSLSTILTGITLNYLSLFFLTTLTSTIDGVFGIGGGLILAVTLPWFVPVNAVVPIHGTTQLASNVSRLMMSYQHVVWSHWYLNLSSARWRELPYSHWYSLIYQASISR